MTVQKFPFFPPTNFTLRQLWSCHFHCGIGVGTSALPFRFFTLFSLQGLSRGELLLLWAVRSIPNKLNSFFLSGAGKCFSIRDWNTPLLRKKGLLSGICIYLKYKPVISNSLFAFSEEWLPVSAVGHSLYYHPHYCICHLLKSRRHFFYSTVITC